MLSCLTVSYRCSVANLVDCAHLVSCDAHVEQDLFLTFFTVFIFRLTVGYLRHLVLSPLAVKVSYPCLKESEI